MFTKLLNEISIRDIGIAGGKGASLGEMIQSGVLVPDGFVVLANTFEEFIKETGLDIKIDSALHAVNVDDINTSIEASEKIQPLIIKTEISNEIKDEIKKEFKKLDLKFVAVRSSATVEDSLSGAWAGQLDSFLNITEENLLENIKKCWASLFTPRAISYRFEKGLHKQEISVAVVVQRMIESESAGIAFSVNPVIEDKNQLVIEAGFGLGEAVVSGSITPDTYVVEKEPKRIVDVSINIQDKKMICSKYGNSEWVDLLEKERGRQILNSDQILELSELILKIENYYGTPQDIEWAVKNGIIYIIQSRPITTLKSI